MTKITQKQLIESLKQLKEIKPRKEWAVSLRSQILAEKQVASTFVELKVPTKQEQSIGIKDIFSAVFFQRKLAYSFAALAFIIVGLVGFAQYTVPGDLLFSVKKMSEQSEAALIGQTGLRQNVVALNSRINELVQVAKDGRKANIPSAIDEINANVSTLTKTLKDNTSNDPATIKEIAASLKVLASVPGTDLSENSDVKDLYQTVVGSQIADLQKTTLTEEQKTTLSEVEDLYKQEKYADALEKILLINK
jgi:hypothetical protein